MSTPIQFLFPINFSTSIQMSKRKRLYFEKVQKNDDLLIESLSDIYLLARYRYEAIVCLYFTKKEMMMKRHV